jgi:hypothetical protein
MKRKAGEWFDAIDDARRPHPGPLPEGEGRRATAE